MQETGFEGASEEVVEEEAAINEATREAETSTTHYTHHSPNASREKLSIWIVIRDHLLNREKPRTSTRISARS